jgi:hypothetical protein
MKHVVSFGGGVNSTAMIIGMVDRKMQIDVVIFADTGGEKPETYAWVEKFFTWLREKKIRCEIVREKITLEQDILIRKTLPPVVFGFKSCSEHFKRRPLMRWLKENYGEEDITQYIGFDLLEARRIRTNQNTRILNKYPLIEWGWDRDRCKIVIQNAEFCLPPKSSCFFCPNMKKYEILALSAELRGRVRKIEANARRVMEMKGLGRNFSWTDLFEADAAQMELMQDESWHQSPCECVDG